MKDIIGKLVKEEVRDILSESEDMIKDIVKTSLLPELRSAIRESIAGEVQGILQKIPTMEEDIPSSMSTNAHADYKTRNRDIEPPSDSEPRALDAEPKVPNDGHLTRDVGQTKGRYLYCIVEGDKTTSLGSIGIDGNEVYAISYKGLLAFVHDCPAEPYRSEDEEIVKGWIATHQDVVDAAWKKFGTVLPMGFDTIIRGDELAEPEENMNNWLKEDYDNLMAKLEKISGKSEYGVQIFWNTGTIAENIMNENGEIGKLNKQIKSKPKGTAYMYRQKLEDLLKKEMEIQADKYFKDFYDEIKPSADDLKVEKTKRTDDENKQMLMNLSCLMSDVGSRKLGNKLDKINSREGFSVRYTGPWPPYSFV